MIELFNGDCFEVIGGGGAVKDNSIDCIITDPPYNVSRETNFHTLKGALRNGMDFGEWDKGFDITSYIKLFPRILKENANVVIFNAWENLGEIAKVCREFNIAPKRCLVLSKSNPAPFNRDRMFVNDVEFAIWGVYNSKNKPSKWTFNRENSLEKCVIPTTVQSSKLHPTMKDEKVINYLLRVLTNENDSVLDLFMGSGTTGVACRKLKRNFIGIELDTRYFEVAKRRIEGIK